MEKEIKDTEVLTVKEAAHFLKSSVAFLYKLRAQGKIKGVKLGRKRLFRKDELIALLDQGQS